MLKFEIWDKKKFKYRNLADMLHECDFLIGDNNNNDCLFIVNKDGTFSINERYEIRGDDHEKIKD